MAQDGGSYSFYVCGACTSSLEIGAPVNTSGPPGGRCPGGVISYIVQDGSQSTTYGSGGGDNNTSYSISAPGCPLSVSMLSFEGKLTNKGVELVWAVTSQTDNQLFVVEKSNDNRFWEPIAFISGDGTLEGYKSYSYIDESPLEGENYYRIKDVDFSGLENHSHSVLVNNIDKNKAKLIETYNLLGQPVNDNYEGFVIEIYTDGSSVKRYRSLSKKGAH